MMDPQQEIFTALLVGLKKLGYDVYDGALPPEKTSYPFIYLADSQLIDDRSMKNAVLADVTQTIHVWHNNVKQRGTVSKMLLDIKRTACKITDTQSYVWSMNTLDQRILNDDTTNTPLIHGLLTIGYRMTGIKEKKEETK